MPSPKGNRHYPHRTDAASRRRFFMARPQDRRPSVVGLVLHGGCSEDQMTGWGVAPDDRAPRRP